MTGLTVTVALENDKYVIIQETRPENGTIEPGNSEVLNENDFYTGQRIYTDTTHDFAYLEREAYMLLIFSLQYTDRLE